MRGQILLIDGDESLRTSLSDQLRREGYVVYTTADGSTGFEMATGMPLDLIILEVMLPNRSGFDVCREIRQAGLATPLMFLTVRNEVVDTVVGLKLGADDYVTKPFKMAELLARVEVLLRRVPVYTGKGVHQQGSIRVDAGRGKVTRDGEPVSLTIREFQLLRYLVERTGRTVSRSELLRAVWAYDSSTMTRTVDVHIASLRQKLELNPKAPELIVTIVGVGYKYTTPSLR